jgi:hypothetical protein
MEPFQLKMLKSFLDLVNLDDNKDTNRTRENIWQNIKITVQKSLSQYER